MTDDPDDELTRLPVDAEQLENDSLSQIKGISRVTSVHAVLTAIHRDPPQPKVEKTDKPAIGLRMTPWSPPPRKAPMMTMTDLSRRGTQGGTPTVARHPKPAEGQEK